MFKHVIKARYIEDFKVWIAFNDGANGEIDLSKKLKNRNGVFAPLQNLYYFKNFKIENDTLSWENGADIAPESLYELLEQQK